MLLLTTLSVPLIGILVIYSLKKNNKYIKVIALTASTVNLFVCLIIFFLFDFSINNYQFVQEYYKFISFYLFLGVDGISIYFIILTAFITPIALLSN